MISSTTASRLLDSSDTANYRPAASIFWGWVGHRKPRFSLRWVPWMLTDPRIQFGLRLMKGPLLANARFFVDSEDKAVKEYLKTAINRFWRKGASKALSAVEWGYSGSQVLYELDQSGLIQFSALRQFRQEDVRIWTLDGQKVGMAVENVRGATGNVFLGGPKSFWHVHDRIDNQWYGSSRLKGSYDPWFELYADGGGLDARRLFYFKYAFSGDTLYHPPGFAPDEQGGISNESNADIADQILRDRRTGAVTRFVNTRDESGNREWELEQGNANIPSGDIRQYVGDLRDEIWEGMGIPPEIGAAEGTGAFAGRRIPQQAFFSGLQEELMWLISDADDQIFRPLVHMQFGNAVDYEIIPFSLLRVAEEETPRPFGGSPPQPFGIGTSSPAEGQMMALTTLGTGQRLTRQIIHNALFALAV